MRIDGNDVCALATAMTQPVVRQRHVDRRMEAPADKSSSSSDAFSFPPLRDGGAPCKIPSNGGGSDISRVVRKFFIGEIRVTAVIVVDPLASPLPSPPSDTWRALLVAAAAAPAATVPFDGSFGDKREANGRRMGGGVVNDPATETGAVAAAAAAMAGNRGGRQQSTTSRSTSILHEIIAM